MDTVSDGKDVNRLQVTDIIDVRVTALRLMLF
jgi:hypothetical protein